MATRIEVTLLKYEDFVIPYVDGDLVGDCTGLRDFENRLLQRVSQLMLNNSLRGGLSSVEEKVIPVSITQMAALVGKKPETLIEAAEILESYA